MNMSSTPGSAVGDPARPAPPTVKPAPIAPRRAVARIGAGIAGGFLLGVVARAWMRLIAEDPGFSWNGTIFIVAAFTIFGLTQSIVAVAGPSARRRSTSAIVRAIGVIGIALLFSGAGALMIATVVCGGLAFARRRWTPAARLICGAVAMLPVALVTADLVGAFGLSLHALLGLIGLVGIYGFVVWMARFTFAARDRSRAWNGWLTLAIALVVCAALFVMTIGFAGG